MIAALFMACDRLASFFGYVPAQTLTRARRARSVALRQAQEQRERRMAAVSRASELERTMAALEAEVADLRRTADRVRS